MERSGRRPEIVKNQNNSEQKSVMIMSKECTKEISYLDRKQVQLGKTIVRRVPKVVCLQESPSWNSVVKSGSIACGFVVPGLFVACSLKDIQCSMNFYWKSVTRPEPELATKSSTKSSADRNEPRKSASPKICSCDQKQIMINDTVVEKNVESLVHCFAHVTAVENFRENRFHVFYSDEVGWVVTRVDCLAKNISINIAANA